MNRFSYTYIYVMKINKHKKGEYNEQNRKRTGRRN